MCRFGSGEATLLEYSKNRKVDQASQKKHKRSQTEETTRRIANKADKEQNIEEKEKSIKKR